jgi:hypothetical protein
MYGFGLPLALAVSVGAVSLFTFIAVAAWSDNRRKEREAYYKSEIVKKMVESQASGGGSALEYLREEEKLATRRRVEGLKLGGMITFAVGIGLMIFLRAIDRSGPTYLVGMIPLLVGLVLWLFAYMIAPKS